MRVESGDTGPRGLSDDFYVYEHRRPDTGECFYVGKGKRRRAYKIHDRNDAHRAVVADLAASGLRPEVCIVASGLTERQAFEMERVKIAKHRADGLRLVNRTDGGDGLSGFIRPLGIPVSPEARAKISAARQGMIFTAQHKAKLAQRKIGVRRKPFKPETIEKMRRAAAAREAAKRSLYGDKVTRTSRVHANNPALD